MHDKLLMLLTMAGWHCFAACQRPEELSQEGVNVYSDTISSYSTFTKQHLVDKVLEHTGLQANIVQVCTSMHNFAGRRLKLGTTL